MFHLACTVLNNTWLQQVHLFKNTTLNGSNHHILFRPFYFAVLPPDEFLKDKTHCYGFNHLSVVF